VKSRFDGLPDELVMRSCLEDLDGKSVTDPHGAVRVDIDALPLNPLIPDRLSVTYESSTTES
jgi:hypothetical protein